VWHVRYSALFALPAILPRLPPKLRRALALESIVPLAADKSAAVRSGVLESLGEVVYAFHQAPDGPPQELVRLFLGRGVSRSALGRNEGGDEGGDEDRSRSREESLRSLLGERPSPDPHTLPPSKELDEFYNDPSRALVCAFNYPAVALALGRARWDELRDVYLELAAIREPRVQRTLAASLGELARIVGADNARRDLMDVWWAAVRSEEGEVRLRAVGCLEVFVGALRGGVEDEEGGDAEVKVVDGLLMVWEEGGFRGWREREGVAKAVVGLAELVGRERPALVRKLLRMALEDGVTAVRETAVSAVGVFFFSRSIVVVLTRGRTGLSFLEIVCRTGRCAE
jgi:serine/threonine-protein phosphatase 4 regulatory subunit 1